MNKKLLLIWTFLLCFVMGISADQVTITFKDSGTSNDGSTSVSAMKDIVSDSCQSLLSSFKASGKIFPAMKGLGVKFGNSSSTGTLELTLKESYKATKLIISAAGYDANSNTFSVNGTNVTGFAKKTATVKELALTGVALNKITISTISGQTRGYLQSITIVYGEGGDQDNVLAPTIEGTTRFLGTTTVTLACATADAKIYYTLDGSDPTNESTEYAAPFTIDATTTVKAIAYKGEKASTVATKEFVKTPEAATVAELNALENNAAFAYTGELTVVAAPTAKHLFVKDAEGNGALIFDNAGSFAFEAGQHIAAGWQGKVSVYNSLFEIVPTTELTAVADVKDEITYDEVAAADVTVENANKVAVLKGVTYAAPAANSKNFEITASEAKVAGYNQFGLAIEAPAEGDTYDILGAISRYKDEAQFQPISFTRNAKVVEANVAPESGDIATAVEEAKAAIAAKGDKAGDLNITLKANADYTVSKAITTAGDINIAVEGEGLANIDAAALAEPFVKLDGCETPAQNVDGTFNTSYKKVNVVSVKGVKISGLKTSLINDAQKSLVTLVEVDNSNINVEGSANIFDFKGYPAMLNISNSTLWSKDGHTGNMIKTSGRVRDLDSDQTLYQESTSIMNSTLYRISVGTQFNNLQGKGQKSLQFTMKSSIIAACTQDGSEVRGWLGGQNSKNPTVVYDNNTYWGEEFAQEGWIDASKQGADTTQTSKNDCPEFASVGEGNFTVEAGTLQAKYKIGDPRWLVEYNPAEAKPRIVDIELEGDANLNDEIAKATKDVDNIERINITLGKNATYTVNAPIETYSTLTITGDNEAPATIDASANNGAFIQLSATPRENNKDKENGEYYLILEGISLKNLNINGVKGQFIYDNNVKYCSDVTIDSCTVKLESDEATGINGNAVIYFKAGFVNTLNVMNSTFWQDGASDAKYFVQYNNSGRCSRAGLEKDCVTFKNCTFSGIAQAGQWCNYGGLAGQKTSFFSVVNNIFNNCSKDIARRILGGRNAASYPEGNIEFSNNTYMQVTTVAEGDEIIDNIDFDNVDGYDVSGTDIKSDPDFTNAGIGDFTLYSGSKQAYLKTGAPRWFVEFVPEDLTEAKAELLAEIQKATALLGDADTETNAAAKALKEAIDKAQNVYDTTLFNDDLDDALEELIAAEEAYKTTAVSSVNAEKNADRAAWYTLQGVRVEKPSKGIFIHNGKKVVLK